MKSAFHYHVVSTSLCFLFFFLLICSCRSAAQKETPAPTSNSSTPSPTTSTATPSARQDELLRKQIEAIASDAKGHVGVAAEISETGDSVSLNPHDHFPMQSVYKLPIAMAVLAEVDNGKLRLEQRVRVEKDDLPSSGHSPIRDKNPNGVELNLGELLRFAVAESDSAASDVLLELIGAEVVRKYLNERGVNEMIIINSEKEIAQDWETQYRNWASPAGAIQLLRNLHERRGISEQSQQLLYRFMTETPTGPRRLKGLLPKTAIVAHKTGTSGTSDRGVTAATNDIGLVTLPNGRHMAIAVFVSDSPANVAMRERTIARIAKAVWDKWGN